MNYLTEDMFHLLPESKYVCVVIPKLFSEAECKGLLTEHIQQSFQKAIEHYPTYYRNNDRLVIDSEPLAQQLLEKVKPFLPEILTVQSDNSVEQGVWHLKELNNRFRYCRYTTGQYFNRHLDGVHYRSHQVQSKLTFMLYLNSSDGFEGGRTLFYRSKESQEIWAAYLPKQGDLIIFDHNIWHEGEKLLAGEKYVLRSDILYEKIAEEDASISPRLTQFCEGHLGYIWKLLPFSNRLFVSGGRDRIIKIWDVNGVCKQRLPAHQNSILCLAQINDNVFISGSRDQTIKVWELNNEHFALKTEMRLHQAVVLSLCKVNDETFASSGGDKLIHISTIQGNHLCTLQGHTDWVWNIIMLSENVLASCSEDTTIKIWEINQGCCQSTLHDHCPVHSIAFDKESNRLISGNFNGEITCQTTHSQFADWQPEKRFQAHNSIIRTLLLINQRYLASGGEDNKVRLWDLSNAQCLAEFQHTNFVQSLALNGNNQLLSASYDGQINTWDLPAEITGYNAARS
ncbi:MAG: 2OG-Fe(II) oxygenase [Bacteroidota bacterium]